MKVSLKIKSRHVVVAHKLLTNIEFSGILTKEEKLHKSLFQQVFLKIAKKSLEVQMNPDDKPVKFNLQYHEAYELEQRLQDVYFNTEQESYERNAVSILKDQLNQKLA